MSLGWLAVLVLAQDGRLWNVDGSSGLPGARLEIRTSSGGLAAQCTTDAAGAFPWPDLPPGSYQLTIWPAAVAPVRLELPWPPANREIRLPLPGRRDSITVAASRGLVENAAESEAAVAAFERDALLQRPLPVLGQLLETTSGTMVQQTGSSQVSPFLRGFTGYQVLNLIDGVRFNNSTFRSGPNQYLAFVDFSQAQRVEAFLGPSSTQYGSDALGGAIYVATRESRFGAGPRWETHGEWNAAGSTADLSATSDALLSVARSRFAWLGGLSGRRHNDLRPGGGVDSRNVYRRLFGYSDEQIRTWAGGRQQDTGFAQTGFHTKMAARLTDRQLLTAWYQRGRQSDARNFKDLLGGLGRLQSDLSPQGLDFAYVRYEKLQLAFLDSLSATASVNSQRDGTVRQNLNFTDRRTTDVSRVDAIGYSAQATTHFRQHALVFGGELFDERIFSTRREFDPGANTTRVLRPLYPDDSRYRTGGLFVQDRVEWGRWRATLGGRFTHVKFRTQLDRALGVAASAQSFDDWTFHTSLQFRISTAWVIHTLVGRGFRAPNANDLGAVGLNDLGYEVPAADAVPAGALLGSNAGEAATSLGRAVTPLRPETLLNYEFGIRFQTRRVSWRAQVFDSELADPIVRRTLLFRAGQAPTSLAGLPVTVIRPTAAQEAQGVVTVATALDPRAVKAFVNDGQARYYGIESSARVAWSARWSLQAGYAFLVGRDLFPNRPVRRLPPQQGSLSVRYGRSRYWLEAALVANGAQSRLNGGDLDDERIGASRSRADIASFYRGSRIQGRPPSGETLLQIQDRVLPVGAVLEGVRIVNDATRVPLYRSTAAWAVVHLHGGITLTDHWSLNAALRNVGDRNYRVHGSGVDAAGFDAFVGVRFRF
jgi:iron complex outermembrane receptor protein/hemoglobin/transferrin/lactoferrin receptor protein